MRTIVCIVPETRRPVTTDNGESLQSREGLCAGRAKQAYEGVLNAWATLLHVRVSPTLIKSFLPPFYPRDVTYAISEPRPSAILSHGGRRSRVTIAGAEGLGTRLNIHRRAKMVNNCSAVGCTNTLRRQMDFVSIGSRWLIEVEQQKAAAVRREPKTHTRICAEHFKTGNDIS